MSLWQMLEIILLYLLCFGWREQLRWRDLVEAPRLERRTGSYMSMYLNRKVNLLTAFTWYVPSEHMYGRCYSHYCCM